MKVTLLLTIYSSLGVRILLTSRIWYCYSISLYKGDLEVVRSSFSFVPLVFVSRISAITRGFRSVGSNVSFPSLLSVSRLPGFHSVPVLLFSRCFHILSLRAVVAQYVSFSV